MLFSVVNAYIVLLQIYF